MAAFVRWVLVCAAVLAPARALAQEVVWKAGGPDCPDAGEFRSLLEVERGADAQPVDVRATASAREVGRDWLVEIDVAGEEEARRQLLAPTCREVAGAAALYLALVLDGVGQRRRASLAPVAETVPSMGVDVAGVLDVGSLPSPSPGAGLRFGWRGNRIGLQLDAAIFDSRRTEVESAPRFGGDFGLAVAGASGCARMLWNVWSCAGLEAGVLSATGIGTIAAETERTLWLSATGALAAAVPVSTRLALVAGAGAGFPLRRKQFEIAGIDSVHQASAAVLRVSLGIRIGFNLTDPNASHH